MLTPPPSPPKKQQQKLLYFRTRNYKKITSLKKPVQLISTKKYSTGCNSIYHTVSNKLVHYIWENSGKFDSSEIHEILHRRTILDRITKNPPDKNKISGKSVPFVFPPRFEHHCGRSARGDHRATSGDDIPPSPIPAYSSLWSTSTSRGWSSWAEPVTTNHIIIPSFLMPWHQFSVCLNVVWHLKENKVVSDYSFSKWSPLQSWNIANKG